MATLVENATRITDALADIKQAIIDKGVTPIGKCETFADAIEQISGGGDFELFFSNDASTNSTSHTIAGAEGMVVTALIWVASNTAASNTTYDNTTFTNCNYEKIGNLYGSNNYGRGTWFLLTDITGTIRTSNGTSHRLNYVIFGNQKIIKDDDMVCVYKVGDASIKNIYGIEFKTNNAEFTDNGIVLANGSGYGFYSQSPIDTNSYKSFWVETTVDVNGQIGTMTTSGSLPTVQTSGSNRSSYIQTTTSLNGFRLEMGKGFYFSNRASAMTITKIWIEKTPNTPSTLSLDEGGEE